MFQRKSSQPGEFNHTKSTIALAVTLLVTLGLAQWYVSTKDGASNTIDLLDSLMENGLSQYIPNRSFNQYYILYSDGQPIGFKYFEQSWRENYLVGKEITSIPNESHLSRVDWNISNNTKTWSQRIQLIENGKPSSSEIHYYPSGKMKYVIDGRIIDTSALSLRFNLIPPFMLDLYSSIGAKEFDDQIELNFLQSGAIISLKVEPGDIEQVPQEYKNRYPEGFTVKTTLGEFTQIIYYSSDHQLIYQKDSVPQSFDTIAIADESEVLKHWPEAEYMVPKPVPVSETGGEL